MPTKYIHFTDEQKEQARRTDLADLLRSQGEALKRSGSEYEWRDGSQKVTIRGNLWFHQYEQKGGDAVDFVRRFYNKSYPEAMVYLLGGASGVLTVSPPIEKKTAEPFVLPEKNDNMRRVYAYLMHHRGVDRDVLYAFAHKGMIYESAEYHNTVPKGMPHMPTCEEPAVSQHSKEMYPEADPNTAFTGPDQATSSICLRLP